VQGFNENVSVLALLAAYAATVRLDIPIVPLMTGFGLLVAAAMALATLGLWRESRQVAAPQVLNGRSNSGL